MGIFRQFPYSNFHEMNMDEIIKIVRELADDWAEYQLKWGNLYADTAQALADFKAYVQNYWDTLDLTSEVNTVIHEMLSEGEFDSIILTQLSPVVTNWLNQHITVPEGVVIDSSLSIAGACADAKATGDGFKYKVSHINGSINAFDYAMERLDGKYANYTNGVIGNAQAYVCYHYIPVRPGEIYWLSSWRSPAHVCFYNHIGKYIGGSVHNEGNSIDHIITTPADCYYISVSYGENNMLNLGEKPATLIPSSYYLGNHTQFDMDYTDKSFYSEEKISNRNIINRMSGYKNYYYNYTNGILSALANYCAIEIPTTPGTQYCCTPLPRLHIAFMTENGTYISGVADNQAEYFVTPANCYVMRIGYRYQTTDETPVYIGLCPKQSNNAVYSEFGSGDIYQIKSPLTNTLTVGTNQQFATISEAVSRAKDGDTILVYPGTYTESVKAYAKKVHIIGTSREHCILQYSANDYYNPALEIAKGSVENMTIKAFWSGDTSIMRAYCVHIDNINLRGETLSFDNVHFISERGATVGVGLRTNSYVKFNNCIFHTTSSGVEGAIYAHDSESETEGSGGYAVYENQNIEFVNCDIINETTDYSIKLQSQERKDGCTNITFINNKVIQPNNNGKTISMTLWEGRTLTNTNYLGSSDFVLTTISGCNSQPILDYHS